MLLLKVLEQLIISKSIVSDNILPKVLANALPENDVFFLSGMIQTSDINKDRQTRAVGAVVVIFHASMQKSMPTVINQTLVLPRLPTRV